MITPVDSVLWRGPRPDSGNFSEVRKRFLTVVSLEGLEEDWREARELAPALVVSKPISSWQILLAGVPEAFLESVLLAIQAASRPVLVHCREGRDRTGLVVAAYRVRQMRWSKEAAMAEAIALGYRHSINFGLNRTWRDFDVSPV